jgi:pyruvate ferredoxin oxidoreductase gamma subunit
VFEIRFHGRGGQGVVTAAETLSIAACAEGRHALAFPSFEKERAGAPVVSYCRLARHEIRDRNPIRWPDCVILREPGLAEARVLLDGLKPRGIVLIDAAGCADPAALRHRPGALVVAIDSSGLAARHGGHPASNAALLGAFAALTGQVSLESIEIALGTAFGGRGAAGNIATARAGHAAARRDMVQAA